MGVWIGYTRAMHRNTVYLLGDSFFTPNLSLNTRLYYDNFAYDRVVRGCRQKDNTLVTTSYSGTGNADSSCNPTSGYVDREDALGAILTLSYDVAQNSNLKFGVNVRQDSHKRENTSGVETQDIRELTSRIFAQYAQRLSVFRVVLAASYDRLDVLKAHQYDSFGGAFTDKKPKLSANYSLQGAFYYDISESQAAHLSVSKKQNMPSIANRYNDSLGRYVKNPDLHSEDVISYELGYDLNLNQTQISAAVFYDDKYGVISTQNLPGSNCPNPTASTYSNPNVCFQYINDDQGYVYGAEIGATQGFFADNLLVIGVNYSYLQQKTPAITGGNPGTRITAYPNHMFNAKVAVKPINSLEIIGSTMLQSPQYSYNNAKGYYDGSNNYFTIDLGANYEIGAGFSVSAGVTNLTDRENFVYWSNPSMSKQIFPGRRYFVGVEYNY